MEEILHQLICKISRSLGRVLYVPGGFLARFLNHQLYQNPTIPMFSSFDSRNHVFNPETLPSTSSPLVGHFGPTEISPDFLYIFNDSPNQEAKYVSKSRN